MKKSILYTCLTLALAGCNKYLDKLPDNRADLDSPEKISELLVSAYPKGNYVTFCESMTDNVTDIGFGWPGNANSDSYFWRDVEALDQDSPEYYWNACYKAIAAANQALDVIAKVSDPQSYRGQKGEALVARAYAHFMLAILFSKTYDPNTAATDMGIPYVLEPETVVFKDYERKTVQYVYEHIEKDLLEGLPLIDEKIYSVPKYHFTKRAANAFASRFYLFKGDWEKVIEHSTAVFPAGNWNDNMRAWLGDLGLLNSSISITKAFSSATSNSNLLLCNTTSWWSRYCTAYRYATNAALANQMRAENVTEGSYKFRWFSWGSGTYWAIPKYEEYLVYMSDQSAMGYNMIPAFSTEEVLLNRAEAYLKLQQYQASMEDLDTWAKGRIDAYTKALYGITEEKVKSFYSTASLDSGLTKTILDIRRVEFFHEGIRWFDILRHKMEVTHRTKEGNTMLLTADDPRKVLQLPPQAIIAGLPANPR